MIPTQPDSHPPTRKGLPPVAWVGIGCGGVLVIAILSTALLVGWGKRTYQEAQETLVEVERSIQAEVEAEMVRVSEEAKREAEELLSRAAIGDPSDIPAWVPRYPDAKDEQMFYHETVEGGLEGSFFFNSSANPQELEKFFEGQTSSFPARTNRTTEEGEETRRTLEYECEGKKLEVILVEKDSTEDTLVIVNYEEAITDSP